MTDLQLKELARRYEIDARVLLQARRWSSSYYLAGYAVECALKARIAAFMKPRSIPDKEWLHSVYTHRLKDLVAIAGLGRELQNMRSLNAQFRRNWDDVVVKWKSEIRYSGVSRTLAQEMFVAVADVQEGVLPWLKSHWLPQI